MPELRTPLALRHRRRVDGQLRVDYERNLAIKRHREALKAEEKAAEEKERKRLEKRREEFDIAKEHLLKRGWVEAEGA